MTQQLPVRTAMDISNDLHNGKCSTAQAKMAAERRGLLAEFMAIEESKKQAFLAERKNDIHDDYYAHNDAVNKMLNM